MSQTLKKKKSPIGKKTAKRPSPKKSKSTITKEKILSNAMQVFSKSPYKTASLRNICNSHTLISYHFGSKPKLFHSLTSKIIDDLNDNIPRFADGIETMYPKKGLRFFIRNFLDYLSENPESMMVINQNLGNSDESKQGLAGLDIMGAVNYQVYTCLSKVLPDDASKKDLKRWCLVFLMYIINFYGAAMLNQIALNLKPYKHTYQNWVEAFLMFHLYPSYNHLIRGPESKEFEKHPGNLPVIIPPVNLEKDGIFSIESKSERKGDRTRKRILKAARTIFAKYPYEVASMRMIGKQGKIEYPLIYHYFPTKEHLFKENAMGLALELFLQIFIWHKDLHLETLDSALDIFTERAVDYLMNNNDAISTIAQNLTGLEVMILKNLGYQYVANFIEGIKQFDPTKRGGEQYQMFQYGQLLIFLYFLGASHYFAKMLGMNPTGNAYSKWLKETHIFVIYPVFRRYVSSVE